AAGFQPFRDIFSDQGPWLLQALYPGYRLLGGSLLGVRADVVLGSLVGLAALYWVMRQLTGMAGAVAVVVLLGISPLYLQFSRIAVAEVLAAAPAILALGCALRSVRSAGSRWLGLTAVLFASSLLIKPITIGFALPIALVVWSTRRRRWRRVLLVGAATFAGVLGGVLLVGLPEILNQIVQFRLASRSAEGWRLGSNLNWLRSELVDEGVMLLALAAAGLVLCLRRRAARALALWAVASIGTL